MATDTIQVIDTDYETIQSLIYSNFINTSKDLENITKNIKEYVTKLGFPFNEYLAYTMSKELPLQPAKELIYNEFTTFENKMNILQKINEKKLEDFCVNLGRNMGINWNHVLKNYNETKLEYEKKMLKIDEYRKKMIEVNTNHIKSINKMKEDYNELKKEIKNKYGSVSELHKVSTKFRKEIQVSILESIKVDINKVIQKSVEAEILTNIITKKDIQNINSYITERLTEMENYFINKYNEIDKIKFLLDEREKIIQNKLEDKLIPLVKIKHNDIEIEEMYEKLEKKLVNETKILKDKINLNHSKLSDKINKKNIDKNELSLKIKECNQKILDLETKISNFEIKNKQYIDFKISEQDKKILDFEKTINKYVETNINKEVSKVKSQYNKELSKLKGDYDKKYLTIQNELKIFEDKINEFYQKEYLNKIQNLEELITKLSNQNVKKDIELEEGVNKLLEKGFIELNKKMDEKISTIFNVAFVPAFNPYNPIMHQEYNHIYPELKSV